MAQIITDIEQLYPSIYIYPWSTGKTLIATYKQIKLIIFAGFHFFNNDQKTGHLYLLYKIREFRRKFF